METAHGSEQGASLEAPVMNSTQDGVSGTVLPEGMRRCTGEGPAQTALAQSRALASCTEF